MTRHDGLVIYEFLLPLTRERELRSALDELFYKDTIIHRLGEIGLDTVERWVPRDAGESHDDYTKRVAEYAGGLFGGYSISHVDGRFLADRLRTRSDAADRLREGGDYLIDETTAVVRFVPLSGSERELGEDRAMADDAEPDRVRQLFFGLFVEAVVRTVQGEEEIWLVEDALQVRAPLTFGARRSA